MTFAHAAVARSDVWTSWAFDPALIALLVGGAWLYARGVSHLWSPGRGRGVRPRQVVAYYGALTTVALALISPVEAVAASLVSGHMAQHLLLLVPAPLLLAYATPGLVLHAGLPPRLREWASALRRPSSLPRRAATLLSGAVVAVALHVTAMFAWHLPRPYEAAVTNDALHGLEHATFLSTAFLFWALAVRAHRRRGAGYPIALLSTFVIWISSGGLGALLTFSSTSLYPVLGHHADGWGISPLTDQQLAGVVMWVPAGFAYLIAMAVLFVKWMGSLERGAPRPAEVPR